MLLAVSTRTRFCYTTPSSLCGTPSTSFSSQFLSFEPAQTIEAPLTQYYRQSVDKRTIVENYDLVSLAIDEIVDDGIILETDPTIITQRVSRAPTQDMPVGRIDLSEQGVNNLAQLGKSKLADWLRQGL